jgi:hypothetical protein
LPGDGIWTCSISNMKQEHQLVHHSIWYMRPWLVHNFSTPATVYAKRSIKWMQFSITAVLRHVNIQLLIPPNNYMEHSLSWEASSCLASQKILNITMFTGAHHWSLSQINPIQNPPPYFINIHFMVSHVCQGLPSGVFLLDFPTKTLVSIYFLTHACYMPNPVTLLEFLGFSKEWRKYMNYDIWKVKLPLSKHHAVKVYRDDGSRLHTF